MNEPILAACIMRAFRITTHEATAKDACDLYDAVLAEMRKREQGKAKG